MSAEQVSLWRGLFPDHASLRSTQNLHYAMRAVNILKDDQSGRFLWVVDAVGMRSGAHGAWRRTVLTELGRIDDEEALREIATQICELKPATSREAVQLIRRWRLGSIQSGDAMELATVLARAIDDYLKRRPDTTWQQVRGALGSVAEDVAAASGENAAPSA